MAFTPEMMAALEADAEKLEQQTGEDHAPVFIHDTCPLCGQSASGHGDCDAPHCPCH